MYLSTNSSVNGARRIVNSRLSATYLFCYCPNTFAFATYSLHCVLLDTLDRRWEIDTVPAVDRSGLMVYRVLGQRLTFSTVVTSVGVDTTVDIRRTFLSVATAVNMVMYIIILNVHFLPITSKTATVGILTLLSTNITHVHKSWHTGILR